MKKEILIGLIVFLIGFIVPNLVEAQDAGIKKHVSATHIYTRTMTLAANRNYTIETLNLSSGADTVLHIQNSNGSYLDGNDDCATRLSGCTGWRSWLHIPAYPISRSIRIIVRGYMQGFGGTATLRVTPSGLAATDYSIHFDSGYIQNISNYSSSAHFYAIEEQGGSIDTMLLLISEQATKAIAFDDDNGIGYMSGIHTNEACNVFCKVIVASYFQSGEGPTTLIWDSNAHLGHTILGDLDMDGLSYALEIILGTSPVAKDTDGDGISDGQEVLGEDNINWELTRYPYFGADPLKPDIFVEADWKECRDNNGWACEKTNGDEDLDRWQLPGDVAQRIAAYYAPEINVHIDNGVDNDDPETWFIYGNWGGATRYAASQQSNNKCDWLSRPSGFHGARILGNGGGQGTTGGKCLDGSTTARIVAHELGHNFNLQHGGGSPSAGVNMNCKPNYKSMMNYAILNYQNGIIGFSRNEFSVSNMFLTLKVLNPMAVEEVNQFFVRENSLDPELDYLSSSNPSFNYEINELNSFTITGRGKIIEYGIDWNRNGKIDSGPVRAAVTWGWGQGGGCETSSYQYDGNNNKLQHHKWSALSWFNGKLYWFTRRISDDKIEYRSANSFPTNCSSPPEDTCRTNWSPALSNDATLVSNSAGMGAPAVAEHHPWLFLVDIAMDDNSQRRLRYKIGMKIGNFMLWSNHIYIGTEAVDPNTSPTIIAHDDQLSVFAISNGILREWAYNNTTNAFSQNSTAPQWTTGGNISALYGIGLTLGWIKNNNIYQQVFMAAIPGVTPQG